MSSSASTKTVLITGGAGGFGLAMACHFCDRGHHVIVCARTESTLRQVADDLPGVRAIRADVGDARDREALFDEITRTGGELDILVNNAAVTRAHDYMNDFTLERDRARDELEINFAGPIELTRMFLSWRRTSEREDSAASIVYVNTPGSLFPLEANPLYCATKAGLHLFTLALRRQLGSSNVKIIEIFPPALDTGLAGDLVVANQAANGPDVIDTVARLSVEGILAEQELILPHPDAARLYKRFAMDFDDALLDQINAGVRRRPGWDAA